jgi:hypothetical protein
MNIAAPNRICPECGARFIAGNGRQRFCTTAHQAKFHDVMKVRGKVGVPFVLAWRQGKRGATDDTRYALGELSALADQWAAEDKAAGRDASLIVTGKRLASWRAADVG